ncbi:MAG: BatA domain-containing protein [Bacteroidota bacterium]
MQLLYPFGFLALIGLLIPVIIHLWSVKQGKTLKIGSIALLGESASATSRSFKLTDWLLFILRCLLIILVAFILAQPFFKTKVDEQKISGWILVAPNELNQVYKTNQKTIDSLLNLGYELHEFNLGFKKMDLADTATSNNVNSQLSYSSLLKALEYKIPSGHTAYVYADDKLNNFSGEIPKISYNLIWKANLDKDSTKFWSTNYLGKAYEAKSTTSATTYTEARKSNLPSLSVAIYEPSGNDAQYVKAALNAIADFSKREILVQNFSRANAKKADIIFWLSEQAINSYQTELKPNAKIFTYQKGKVENLNNATLQLAKGLNHETLVNLYKRVEFDYQKGVIIWKDSFGEPLLMRNSNNNFIYFNFFSRLNPQFTDLVWNDQFVSALMPIVLGGEKVADFGFETNELDQRTISKNQLLTTGAVNALSFSKVEKDEPLNRLFWILAFLILLLERILSFRKTNMNYVKR